jgi:stage II sporulation protein P
MQSYAAEMPEGSVATYSDQWDKTIVDVGWHLASDLHQEHISVVQARVNNMADGVLAAYYLSYHTATQLLKRFPSVKMLLDIQRGEGDRSQSTVVVQGVPMGKVTLVVGTNELLPDAHWRQNDAFAQKLEAGLQRIAPGILGPHPASGIELVPYRYNQQVLDQDIIVEIGGPDNSLAQENQTARVVARALAALDQ